MSPARVTPKVFISYRREETSGQAGRIYDAMTQRFGSGSVFIDIDLEPGIDFVERIRQAVGACHVLLVIMGPRWAALSDDGQRPRITDPDDFVRLEVETALRRSDVTVIPVLVAGAQMPDPDELPEEVRTLARLNALEISHTRWSYDIGRLMDVLDRRLEDTTGVHDIPDRPADERRPTRTRPPLQLVVEGVLVAAAAALAARGLGELIKSPELPTTDADKAEAIVTTVLRRGETWAIVGAGLAAWLTTATRSEGNLAASAVTGLGMGALAGVVGGAIFAVPGYLAEHPALPHTTDAVEAASLAATGGILGALLGRAWFAGGAWLGLVAGLAAGALVQLLTAEAGVKSLVVLAGIQAAAIAGAVLAALHAGGPRAVHDPG